MVEVWFKGGNWPLESQPVGFELGPIRTAADGSFQTPDNLLVGSQYRVVVRARGWNQSFRTGSRSRINRGIAPSVAAATANNQRPCRRPARQAGQPESKYSSRAMARNEQASGPTSTAGSRSAVFAKGRCAFCAW